MYQYYGDTRILEEHYDGLRKYVEFLRSTAENGVLKWSHYGDWVAIEKGPETLVKHAADEFCVPAEHPCDPYTNMQRFAAMQGIYVMVSPAVTFAVPPGFSAYGYDHYPSYDFARWPDPIFVDPDLTPDASKLARSNLRQEVLADFCTSCLPEGYYLGDPSQLSNPMHGEIHGIVDGTDPRSGVAIGGIFMKLPGKLHGLTELLITRERDPSRLNQENYHRMDLLPGPDSVVFLVGRKDESFGYIRGREVWGVTMVQLENPYGLPVFMRMVIFTDIDNDPVGI